MKEKLWVRVGERLQELLPDCKRLSFVYGCALLDFFWSQPLVSEPSFLGATMDEQVMAYTIPLI